MLKHGTPFTRVDATTYDEQQRQHAIKRLKRTAHCLGLELVAAPAPQPA